MRKPKIFSSVIRDRLEVHGEVVYHNTLFFIDKLADYIKEKEGKERKLKEVIFDNAAEFLVKKYNSISPTGLTTFRRAELSTFIDGFVSANREDLEMFMAQGFDLRLREDLAEPDIDMEFGYLAKTTEPEKFYKFARFVIGSYGDETNSESDLLELRDIRGVYYFSYKLMGKTDHEYEKDINMKDVFEGIKEVYCQFYQDRDDWLIEEEFFHDRELKFPKKFRKKVKLIEEELKFMFS